MSSAPKIKLSEIMSGRLDAKTLTQLLRPAYREADALDLLAEALELLEQAAKRLPRRSESVRCEKVKRALRSSDPLFGFTKALAIYAMELEPKQRGRKPAAKVASSAPVGRPLAWTPTLYADLLRDFERGRDVLLGRNERVTDADALFEALKSDELISDKALKSHVRRWAKRLPDARQAVRKLSSK